MVIYVNIIIASNNKNKIREFKKIFEHTDFKLYTPSELNINLDVEETGKTFEENALIKARAFSEASNMIAIADDSGLCCDALNGDPGVYSARFAGDMHDDDLNNKKLMSLMKDKDNRHARYVCAICFYNTNGKYVTVSDFCEGLIVDEPKGYNGFGYDPYFYVESFKKTMAELTLDEKNTISHRSKALEKMKEEYVKALSD